jgi:tRNA U34 5-methylaminomethyl-2-thiouridine-forming methyltransferase MnmC
VAGELWEQGFLCEVARRMGPRAILSTYSSAFAVRLALRRAGLAVGLGPRVGRKATGTLASLEAALPPLEPRTARRLAARGPAGPENPARAGEMRGPFA